MVSTLSVSHSTTHLRLPRHMDSCAHHQQRIQHSAHRQAHMFVVVGWLGAKKHQQHVRTTSCRRSMCRGCG